MSYFGNLRTKKAPGLSGLGDSVLDWMTGGAWSAGTGTKPTTTVAESPPIIAQPSGGGTGSILDWFTDAAQNAATTLPKNVVVPTPRPMAPGTAAAGLSSTTGLVVAGAVVVGLVLLVKSGKS